MCIVFPHSALGMKFLRKYLEIKILQGGGGGRKIYIYIYINGVRGGKDLTSGECSLGQTIPI